LGQGFDIGLEQLSHAVEAVVWRGHGGFSLGHTANAASQLAWPAA
jgi:hypothetical protein